MGMGWSRKVVESAMRTPHPSPPWGTEWGDTQWEGAGRMSRGSAFQEGQRLPRQEQSCVPPRNRKQVIGAGEESTGRGAPVSHGQDLAFPSEGRGKKPQEALGSAFRMGYRVEAKRTIKTSCQILHI